jgi:hypothetical protein
VKNENGIEMKFVKKKGKENTLRMSGKGTRNIMASYIFFIAVFHLTLKKIFFIPTLSFSIVSNTNCYFQISKSFQI